MWGPFNKVIWFNILGILEERHWWRIRLNRGFRALITMAVRKGSSIRELEKYALGGLVESFRYNYRGKFTLGCIRNFTARGLNAALDKLLADPYLENFYDISVKNAVVVAATVYENKYVLARNRTLAEDPLFLKNIYRFYADNGMRDRLHAEKSLFEWIKIFKHVCLAVVADIEMIKFLLEKVHNRMTVIMCDLPHNREAIKLVETRHNVVYSDTKTLMYAAAREGYLDVVKCLLDGAGLCSQAFKGAYAGGRRDIIEYLRGRYNEYDFKSKILMGCSTGPYVDEFEDILKKFNFADIGEKKSTKIILICNINENKEFQEILTKIKPFEGLF
jgi:hypothetical protein